MTKAEKFIQDYTNHCSNELEGGGYHEWLTPEQAKAAVEIARKETIEKACNVIRHKYGHYHYLRGDITEELINDFIKAMKDE